MEQVRKKGKAAEILKETESSTTLDEEESGVPETDKKCKVKKEKRELTEEEKKLRKQRRKKKEEEKERSLNTEDNLDSKSNDKTSPSDGSDLSPNKKYPKRPSESEEALLAKRKIKVYLRDSKCNDKEPKVTEPRTNASFQAAFEKLISQSVTTEETKSSDLCPTNLHTEEEPLEKKKKVDVIEMKVIPLEKVKQKSAMSTLVAVSQVDDKRVGSGAVTQLSQVIGKSKTVQEKPFLYYHFQNQQAAQNVRSGIQSTNTSSSSVATQVLNPQLLKGHDQCSHQETYGEQVGLVNGTSITSSVAGNKTECQTSSSGSLKPIAAIYQKSREKRLLTQDPIHASKVIPLAHISQIVGGDRGVPDMTTLLVSNNHLSVKGNTLSTGPSSVVSPGSLYGVSSTTASIVRAVSSILQRRPTTNQPCQAVYHNGSAVYHNGSAHQPQLLKQSPVMGKLKPVQASTTKEEMLIKEHSYPLMQTSVNVVTSQAAQNSNRRGQTAGCIKTTCPTSAPAASIPQSLLHAAVSADLLQVKPSATSAHNNGLSSTGCQVSNTLSMQPFVQNGQYGSILQSPGTAKSATLLIPPKVNNQKTVSISSVVTSLQPQFILQGGAQLVPNNVKSAWQEQKVLCSPVSVNNVNGHTNNQLAGPIRMVLPGSVQLSLPSTTHASNPASAAQVGCPPGVPPSHTSRTAVQFLSSPARTADKQGAGARSAPESFLACVNPVLPNEDKVASIVTLAVNDHNAVLQPKLANGLAPSQSLLPTSVGSQLVPQPDSQVSHTSPSSNFVTSPQSETCAFSSDGSHSDRPLSAAANPVYSAASTASQTPVNSSVQLVSPISAGLSANSTNILPISGCYDHMYVSQPKPDTDTGLVLPVQTQSGGDAVHLGNLVDTRGDGIVQSPVSGNKVYVASFYCI